MSNYNSLKTIIDANIKQNGNQEITGQILNSVLNQMVTTLGAGYQFAGVATLDPATDPGTPDAKVFYIANGKGTYTNFSGLEVTEDEVVVLYWDTAWHKVSTGIASQAKLSELESEVGELDYTKSEYYEQPGIITKTGAATSSANWTRYIIKKTGYSRIRVTAYTSVNFMAIAFYNSLEWGESSFIAESSVVGKNYTQSYDVTVPEDCACIIVCNNTSNRPLPEIKLYGKGGLEATKEAVIPLQVGEDSGVYSPLSELKFKDTTGISESTGNVFTNNATITCDIFLKVADYAVNGRIYFAYKGDSTNRIHTAIAFYTSAQSFISRSSYISADSIGVPFNAVYFKLSLSLVNSKGEDIGGHASDYDLDNEYIRKSLYLITNQVSSFVDIPIALGLENADEIIDNYTIYLSTGATTTANGRKIYLFKNYNYSVVEAFLGANPSIFAAIAFYRSDSLDANSFISGVASINADASDYSSPVPEGCELIAICANETSIVPSVTIYAKSLKSAFDKMDERYSEVKDKIGDSSDIVSLNEPLQMPHILQQMKFAGGVKSPTSVNPLVLLHFSDIHGGNIDSRYLINKTTLQRIIKFKSTYESWIDDIICTGDECYQDITDRQDFNNEEDWWDSVEGSNKILPVLGNHDTWASGSEVNGSAGQESSFNALFNHLDDCNPTGHPNGKCYYYKDYTTQAIRLIVVDPYYSDSSEEEWFAGVLYDAKEKSLSVIIAIHPPFNSYTPLDCTFNSLRFNGTFTPHVPTDNYISMVDSFLASGGKLICWLTGHVHGDVIGFWGADRKQLMICVPSAKAPRSANTSAESNNVDMRILGTKSQDSFNLISFETAFKTITVKRIGSDYDVALRHRGVLCVNYETMEVLYND